MPIANDVLATGAEVSVLFSEPKIPQSVWSHPSGTAYRGFSALQRAENSSIIRFPDRRALVDRVSVLFSEPKIPQSKRCAATKRALTVSVLFSEPKIPQSLVRFA